MFIKRVEDFICENCSKSVRGDGYTNHCPFCLYSKHVDIEPGDRLAKCGGIMLPIGVSYETGNYVLTHKCLVCGHFKRNKVHGGDNMDAVFKVARDLAIKS